MYHFLSTGGTIRSSISTVDERRLSQMISNVTSIFKIVLGALIARYFEHAFTGGYWAGGILLITSVMGLCSFTGFMLLLNIVLNFISILVTMYAVLVDSMLADYFNFTIHKCNFPPNEIQCYCDATYEEYRGLIYYLDGANCNNVFARNPQLLIINAALSAVCFVSSLIIFALLTTAYSYIFHRACRMSTSVQDFTINS